MKKYYISFLLLLSACFVFAQNNYKEATIAELIERLKNNSDVLVLDVRSSGEYMDTIPGGRKIGIGRIKNALNIPITDLLQKPDAIKKLNDYKDKEIYVICSHSYRSRRISNLLLQNGFTNVTNVQGGMTEWYRDHESLNKYSAQFLENNVRYNNLAPAELFQKLKNKETVTFIGFSNTPRFSFDSLVAPLYPLFPDIPNTLYFTPKDSLLVLEKAKSAGGGPIVLFNTIGGGATEASHWLAEKGIPNVHYLIGNLAGYYEYVANYQPSKLKDQFTYRSKVQYFTPLSFCNKTPSNVTWIDLRHDTTFNKITKGTKLEYKTLHNAVNFPHYKTADDFEKSFTDKSRLYMVLPEQGYAGIELVNTLAERGYKMGWIIGGIERWEWYTNNIREFKCGNILK